VRCKTLSNVPSPNKLKNRARISTRSKRQRQEPTHFESAHAQVKTMCNSIYLKETPTNQKNGTLTKKGGRTGIRSGHRPRLGENSHRGHVPAGDLKGIALILGCQALTMSAESRRGTNFERIHCNVLTNEMKGVQHHTRQHKKSRNH